jgi:hypothetical protein
MSSCCFVKYNFADAVVDSGAVYLANNRRAQAVVMIVGNGCMTGQTVQLNGGLSFI